MLDDKGTMGKYGRHSYWKCQGMEDSVQFKIKYSEQISLKNMWLSKILDMKYLAMEISVWKSNCLLCCLPIALFIVLHIVLKCLKA